MDNQNNHNIIISKQKLNIFIVIFSLLLFFSITAAFLIGMFLFPSKSHQKNNADKKDVEQLEDYFLQNFYKDITKAELKKAYYDAIFNLSKDKYTRLTEVFQSVGTSEGGYGFLASKYQNNSVKGLLVESILNGTNAAEDIKKIGKIENIILPGDIIVEYEEDGIFKKFSNIENFESDLKNDEIFSKVKLSEENPLKKIMVINPKNVVKKGGEEYFLKREVTIRYKKYDTNEVVDFSLNNDKKLFTTESKKVAYLKIKEFTYDDPKVPDSLKKDTFTVTRKAMNIIDEYLKDSDTNELVIDLRYNPGGELNSVYRTLGIFIPNNGVHINMFALLPNALKKNIYEGMELYTNSGHGSFNRNYKIKVLVNNRSASAAEVFSSVMKENCHNCKVYGQSTYGKDVFQKTERISGLDPNVFFGGVANASITAGKWGYYKKGETDNKKIVYITDKNGAIISEKDQKVDGNIYDFLFSKLAISKNILKHDDVDVEILPAFSLFLMTYINDNPDKFSYLTDQEKKDSLEYKLLRVDGYFDEKIKKYLEKFNEYEGSNEESEFDNLSKDKYTFYTFARAYRYLLSRKTIDYNGSLIYDVAKTYDRQLLEVIKK